MNLMKHLTPDFVKLDYSFAQKIDQSKEKLAELKKMVTSLQETGVSNGHFRHRRPDDSLNALASGYYFDPRLLFIAAARKHGLWFRFRRYLIIYQVPPLGTSTSGVTYSHQIQAAFEHLEPPHLYHEYPSSIKYCLTPSSKSIAWHSAWQSVLHETQCPTPR